MQITMIKFATNQNPEPIALRLHAKAGQKRNIYCHQGSEENLKNVLAAIQSCLSMTLPGEPFKFVQLSFVDGSGNIWTIERRNETRNFYLNGKPVTANINTTEFGTFLDLEDSASSTNKENFAGLRMYGLFTAGDELCAEAIGAWQGPSHGFSNLITVKCRDLLKLCTERFVPQKELALAQILELTPKLEGLHASWIATKNAYAGMKTELPLYKLDQETIDKTAKELQLIEKIKKIADQLTEPSSHSALLLEKLDACEEAISTIISAAKIDPDAHNAEPIDWDFFVNAFAQLKTQEFIAREIASGCERVKTETKELSDEITTAIGGILDNEAQIAAELNSCLDKAYNATRTPPPPPSLASRAKKRIKSALTFHHETEVVQPAGRIPGVMADQNQLAIEYGIERMTELRSSLIKIRPSVDKSLLSLQKYYEKLAATQGVAKNAFEQELTAHGLSIPSDIKQFVELLKNHTELTYLLQIRELYTTQMSKFKVSFKELEDLIINYRTLTGSQKQLPLDRKSLLLAEARGIAGYHDQKQEKLDKIRKLQIHNGIVNTLHKQFKTALTQIGDNWNAEFAHHGLAEQSIDDGDWGDLFQNINMLKPYAWEANTHGVPLNGEKIFTPATFEAPLALFVMPQNQLNNNHRIKLLEYLEKAPAYGLAILLTSDAPLVEMMQRIGIGSSVALKPRASQPATTPAVASTPQDALNKKTEDILRLLTPTNRPTKEQKATLEKLVKKTSSAKPGQLF